MKNSKATLAFLLMAAILSFTQSNANGISEKYNRKIVFSKSFIAPGTENEADFITDYKPGEELYYKLFMDSTVKQFMGKWGHKESLPGRFKQFYIKFYIDDKYIIGYRQNIEKVSDDEFAETSSFAGPLFTEKSTDTDPFSLADKFKEFMGVNTAKLSGKHQVKVEIDMYDKYETFEVFGSGVLNVIAEPGAQSIAASTSGIKNEFHKQHLKKLVFGIKPLGAELKDADVIKDYTVGQPLYYRVMMDNTLEAYIKKQFGSNYDLSYFKSVYLKFYLDGQLREMSAIDGLASIDFTNEEKASITSFGGLMLPDKTGEGGKQNLSYVFEKFLFKYNRILSGTHKLKIEMYLYSQGLNKTIELIGNGELTIHLTTISRSHSELCYTPTAAATDATLEAKMVAAYNEYNKSAGTAKKTYLKFADWDIRKNDLTGAIISKYRNAVLLIETKEGNCSYQEITFEMDYESNGHYGHLHYSGLVTGGYHPVLCECLK